MFCEMPGLSEGAVLPPTRRAWKTLCVFEVCSIEKISHDGLSLRWKLILENLQAFADWNIDVVPFLNLWSRHEPVCGHDAKRYCKSEPPAGAPRANASEADRHYSGGH